ncbi:hypothetical protein GCM10028798_01020 [Humibacter antri]
MAAAIPAGWYPNPWNDAEELYWSGAEWTGISRAARRVAPQQGTPVTSDGVEDSTIMRPVGPAATRDAAPLVAAPDSSVGTVQPLLEQSYPTVPYGDQQHTGLSYVPTSAPGPNPFGPPAYTPPAYVPSVDLPPDHVPSAEVPSAYAPLADVPPAYAPLADVPPAYARPAEVPPAYARPAYAPRSDVPPTYATGYSAPQYAPPAAPSTPDASAPPEQPQFDPARTTTDAASHSDAPHTDSADAATIRWALSAGAQPQPENNPRARFGLIAMIVGIVAAVFAVIPGLSFAAWIPAFVAIGFGIVGYLGGRPRAFSLTGIIAGGAALAVGTAVSIWFLAQLGVLAR